MEYNQEYIDELIARYLAGYATDADTTDLMNWRESAPENDKHFEQMRFLFEKAAQFFPIAEVDTDKAWNKVKFKIEDKPTQSIIVEAKKTVWGKALRIAAVIVFLLGLTELYLFQKRDKGHEKLFSLSSEKEAIKRSLPDGTDVMLQSNSKLVAIAGKRREYALTGKAKFYVKHNEKEPFILHTDNVLIKDIGTVFFVNSIPRNDTISVRVDTGSVQLYTTDQQGIILAAGEQGMYLKSSRRFIKKELHPINTNEIQFENATLVEVATKLNVLYGVDLKFGNEHIKTCRITVKFKRDENVNDMVDIIKQTFALQSKTEGKTITLYGKGCE